jgi:hypothetical protein
MKVQTISVRKGLVPSDHFYDAERPAREEERSERSVVLFGRSVLETAWLAIHSLIERHASQKLVLIH